jgi:serpin B
MKLAKLSVLLFAFAFFSCSGDDQTEEEGIMNEAPKAEEAQGNQRNDSLVANMLPQTRAVNLTAEQRKFVQKNNDF